LKIIKSHTFHPLTSALFKIIHMKKIYLLFTLLFLISAQASFATLCDLKVKKDLKSAPFFKGDTIVYELSAMNSGSDTLFTVKINDSFPTAFLQFNNDSLSNGTSYDPLSQVWTIDTIAPGATMYLYVKAVILKNQRIKSIATVMGAGCSPVPSDTISFSAGICHLTIKKTVNAPPYYEGDTLLYTIRIINTASDSIFSITTEDIFPSSSLTFVSDSTSPHSSYNKVTQLWAIDTINGNDSTFLYIKASIKDSATTFDNIASVKYASCYSGVGYAGGGGGSSGSSCQSYYSGCFGLYGGGSGISSTCSSSGINKRLKVSIPNQMACDGSTITLNPVATGGAGSNTFTWGATGGPSVTPTSGNSTYDVTVTDVNGRKANASVTITVNPLPAPVLSYLQPMLCEGQSTTILTGVSGTAVWTTLDPNGGTVSGNPGVVFPLLAGSYNYSVTITDGNGCTGSANTSSPLIVNSLPTINAGGNQSVCKNSSYAFPTIVTGNAPFSFLWSPGTNLSSSTVQSPVFSPAIATDTYTVTVTDINGCSATDMATITVSPLDDPTFSYSTSTFCQSSGGVQTPSIVTTGGTFSSTVVSGGGANNLSSFDGTNGSFDLSLSDLGTYKVKYVTAGTCKDSSELTITITNSPVADFHYSSSSYCQKSMPNPTPIFDNSGSAGVFSSTSGLNFVSTFTGEIDLATSISGTYTITNTISSSSCVTVFNTFDITINPLPTANAGVDTAFCIGTTGNIGRAAIFGSVYSWTSMPAGAVFTPNNTTSNPSISPTVTTTFTLTETEGTYGCSNSNLIIVTVNPLPVAPMVTSPIEYCVNSVSLDLSSSVSGTGTLTYYGPNSTTANASTIAPTPNTAVAGTMIYYVNQSDVNGCFSPKASVTVNINPEDVASISYTSNQYCQMGAINPLATITGKIGGTFSISPALTGFNTATGEMPLSNTVAGTCYDITYNTAGTSGNCHITSIFNVCILSTPKASFSYGSYCKDNTQSALPLILSGSLSGGTFKLFPASQTGITVDSTTGSVGLGGTPNRYKIRHTVPASTITGCPTVMSDSSITINALPKAAISGISTIKLCAGNSTTIKAVVVASNSSYQWLKNGVALSGQVNDSITVNTAGNYSIVANTLTCGSDTSASVSVIVNAAIAVTDTVLNNVSCHGGADGIVLAKITGGTLPYSYLWNTTPASNIDYIFGQVQGTYTVTVTDGFNCTQTASATVTEPIQMILTSSFVSPKCYGTATAVASYLISGGTANYTYKWSNDSTRNEIRNVKADIYFITVTDNKGCSAVSSVNIPQSNQITVIHSSTPVSCNGGSNGNAFIKATGGVNGSFKYLWETGSIINSITMQSAKKYGVVITDTISNCMVTDSVLISQPDPISILSSHVNVKCKGSGNGFLSIIVNGGNGSYSYKWKALPTDSIVLYDSTSQNIGGLVPSTYTIKVTDYKGCSASAVDSIIEPLTVLKGVISHTDVLCTGASTGSAIYTVTGGTKGYTYLWSNNLKTAMINNIPAGDYTVIATDSNGCHVSDIAKVIVPSPIVTTTYVQNAIVGLPNGKAYVYVVGGLRIKKNYAGYKYLWNDPLAQTTDTMKNVFAGNYIVQITDSNNCVVKASVVIGQSPVGIASIDLDNSISVFPNPSQGLFMVNISQERVKIVSVKVYSIEGILVYNRQINTGEKQINTSVDLSGLSSGLYYLEISSNDAVARKKIVIQK
jgi:uncharacterized repeat protein (TIGR01451 family)